MRVLPNLMLLGAVALSVGVSLAQPLEIQRIKFAGGDVAALIQKDVAEGDGAGIRMTPTTFINGRMLSGRQSLETLEERVAAILTPGAQPPAGKQAASHLDLLDYPSTGPPAAAGEVKCCGL